jgi:hypothetical protein
MGMTKLPIACIRQTPVNFTDGDQQLQPEDQMAEFNVNMISDHVKRPRKNQQQNEREPAGQPVEQEPAAMTGKQASAARILLGVSAPGMGVVFMAISLFYRR